MMNTAYRYALAPPRDWSEQCERQMAMSNELWNALVEIERGVRERVRAIADADPEVAALRAKYESADAECERLVAEIKRRRAAARSKKSADTEELEVLLAKAKKQRGPIGGALKDAARRAREENRDKLRQIENERLAAVKAARQKAAAGGLYWGSYNAVIDSYEIARGRAMKDGTELKFRKWRNGGEGRLVNQIIGGMSIRDLFSGEKSQVRLEKGAQRNADRWELVFNAFTADRKAQYVRFPFKLHRAMPKDARIQMITVTRVAHPDPYKRWHVVFSLRLGDPQECRDGIRAAVNLGWRLTPDGIRVATILRDGCAPEFVHVPGSTIKAHELNEVGTSAMAEEIEALLAVVREIPLETAPEELRRTIESVMGIDAKRMHGRHLHLISLVWERVAPEWRPADFRELREFGKRWRYYRKQQAVSRDRARNAYLDHYRCEVARLLGGVKEVIVNAHDMRDTAAKDAGLTAGARRQRMVAAPSEFRSALLNYARQNGVAVVERDAKHDACACHGVLFREPDRAALHWSCPVSGAALDQDVDYCRAMLDRAGGEPDAGGARSGQEADQKRQYRANRKRPRENGKDAGDRSTLAA